MCTHENEERLAKHLDKMEFRLQKPFDVVFFYTVKIDEQIIISKVSTIY